MKRNFTLTGTVFLLVAVLSSFATLIHSLAPPEGYTGADGVYCNNCHQGNALNTAGGSVTANGLPANDYTAGSSYNFSIAISHAAADRKRWGFSIAARNSLGQDIGTFSTTNANAANNGTELSHAPAVITGAQSSFTYDNLTWTAPVSPGANDNTVTFYFAGNAANGSGSSGDYIYAATKTLNLLQAYTFTGNGNWSDPANWSNNSVPPAIISGNASIVIDPVANGECVLNVEQHISAGVNVVVKEGKRFRIAGSLVISK